MEIGASKTPRNSVLKFPNDGKAKTSVSTLEPQNSSTINDPGQSRRQISQGSAYDSRESNDTVNGGDSKGRMTSAQTQAQVYLNEKKIFELFNFLIGHLLVDEPIDPIEYLADLLDKCMLFRSGLRAPPLLFSERHVESMFQSLDPGGLGHISMDQYKAGMTTLGIGCYDMNPRTCGGGRVEKQTFEEEATNCLVRMLSEMISKKQ